MDQGEPVGSATQDRTYREALWLFREQVYHAFDRRRDALFEVLDALLVTGSAPSCT